MPTGSESLVFLRPNDSAHTWAQELAHNLGLVDPSAQNHDQANATHSIYDESSVERVIPAVKGRTVLNIPKLLEFSDAPDNLPKSVMAFVPGHNDDNSFFEVVDYNRIFAEFKVEGSQYSGPLSSPYPGATTAGRSIRIQGVIDLIEQELTFVNSKLVAGVPATPQLPGSPVKLAFLDSSGVVIAQEGIPFTLWILGDGREPAGTPDLWPVIFSATIPVPEGTSEIEVRLRGLTLTTIPLSVDPPSVRLIYPQGGESFPADEQVNIQWEGLDPDSDDLTYSVYYSTDAGGSYAPIGTGLSESSLSWSMDVAKGTVKGLIKVVASDGTLSAEDVSGLFSVSPKPPRLAILQPRSNTQLLDSQSVRFRGTGFDLEDGTLGGKNFVWTSNVDGLLGTGSDIRSGLSSGTHTITLTGSDSDGNQGAAQEMIFVLTDTDQDGLSDELEGRVGLDPTNPSDASRDEDGDGLVNADELLTYRTDPRDSDTDGDGTADGSDLRRLVAGEPSGLVIVTPTPTQDSMQTSPTTGSAGYTLETSVEPHYSGGIVTLEPPPRPDGSYSVGTVVNLTALPSELRECHPSPYWSFTSWLGDLQGSEPMVEIIMDADKAVTAGFGEYFPPPCSTPSLPPTPVPTPNPTVTTDPTPTPAALPPVNPDVPPHVFVGTVTIGGATAQDGTAITAWIQDYLVPVGEAVVSSGDYSIKVPQYGTEPFKGRTITFKIGGLDAHQSTVWLEGEGDILNLTASGTPVDDSSWSIETINDSENDVGKYTGVAYGEGPDFHIAYFDDTQNDLLYTLYSTVGAAETEVVMEQSRFGQYSDIAISPVDKSKHISHYVQSPGANLGHAWLPTTGGGWQLSVADSVGTVGQFSSMAVGKDGVPHMAYYDATDNDLKHAWGTWDSVASQWVWANEVVDSAGNVGQHTSIAVDERGALHIAYYSTANGGSLKHAYGPRDAVTERWKWTVTEVSDPPSGNAGKYASSAIDPRGRPHVVYFLGGPNALWHAWQSSIGDWNTEEVDDSVGSFGGHTDLAIAADGTLHIAYYGAANDSLKYAAGAYNAEAGLWSWTTEVVDDPQDADVGMYPSIVVHESGSVYIAYYDETNGNLKLAHK